MTRRLPALLLILGALVATVVVARDPVDAEVAQFSQSAAGWMPAAPASAGLTETWFCPGVPATGTDGVSGEIVVANRRNARLLGSALLMNELGENARVDVSVDPLSTGRILLPQQLTGSMVGALIEIEQGGGLVEQVARHPAGDSVAPCTNAVGDRWYLADGFTVEGSLDQVVLTNPFEQTVVVNLEFATREGPRQPGSYRGLTIPPRSVRVIDLGRPGAGAQSEPLLAVSVEATRGRLVVGRFQRFLGGGREGAQVTVAQPAVREQWWFADVVKGEGVSEQYSIYTQTDRDATVDVFLLGGSFVPIDPIDVPAREVATFVPDEVEAMLRGAERSGGPKAAVLRACIALAPGAVNFITASLALPVMPVCAGADPPMQFLHVADYVAAVDAVLGSGRSGTWNVAGDGTVSWRALIELAGSRPLPLPEGVLRRLVDVTWRLHLQGRSDSSGLPLSRHPWLASTERIRRELGWSPQFSSLEAVESWADGLRRGTTRRRCRRRPSGERPPD